MTKASVKARIAGAIFLAVSLTPALARAAESDSAGGRSWLALVFYVINTAIFIYICVRFGGPMVTGYFGARTRSIIDTIGRSRKALAEAEKLAHEAEQLVARLEDEKKQLLSDLERETAYHLKTIRDAAINAAERVKSDIESTMAAAADNARRRLRLRLAESAGALARELISKNVNDDDQHRTIHGFIAKLAGETPGETHR